jgi:thiosulfate/3-mercaptopyruvate sulfurtransferase
VTLIGPEALAARLERGDDVVVLDATVLLDRPPQGGPYTPRPQRDAFAREHLPGARFADLVEDLADPAAPFPFALPSPERFAWRIALLGVGDGTPVVAYAQDGPMWATRLWWLLRYFGHDDVRVLDGGLPAWRAAGLPLTDAPTPPPAAAPGFTPRPRPELLATRADVEAIVRGDAGAGAAAPACLVNALPPAVFRGEGPSSYSRPGRIPGSVNVPHATLIDPTTNRFRPASELAAAFAAALPDDGPVVAYCGGGISATVDVFALALLGRDDVRLYDGSLTEWTADPALPVEAG